jgi:glycosyltransferase A (GT-A) superfamily protein (DUF2064 family)
MAAPTTLLVMAKAPVPGRVKTRLCPPCRPEHAAAIAAAALADTLEVVAACAADRKVVALAGEPGPWLPTGVAVIPQVAGSFEARLRAAWASVSGPTVQIGMDTPQVSVELLDGALDAVRGPSSAVLGPATDGGWWALGMRDPVATVFAGVPMSTHATGDVQLCALRAHGMEPVLLPVLRDIDTIADAEAVAATIPGSRTAVQVAAALVRVSATSGAGDGAAVRR